MTEKTVIDILEELEGDSEALKAAQLAIRIASAGVLLGVLNLALLTQF